MDINRKCITTAARYARRCENGHGGNTYQSATDAASVYRLNDDG